MVGNNSYEVYVDLKKRHKNMEEEIVRMRNENARLQKEYFELKSLEPEMGEE
jgi:hypothetical protein